MNRKYRLNNKMKKLVSKLANLILKNIKGKFVLCGIYTGGVILGEELSKNFNHFKIAEGVWITKFGF